MTLPDANKARVLWNKGQNMFSAFFAEIAEVRKAIGDDAVFARWCWDELHLPVTAVTRVADVLALTDAARVKAELATVRATEQERKRQEREAREALAEAERKRKEEQRIAAAAEKARREAEETEREKEQERERRKKESKRKNNAGWKRKQQAELRQALATVAEGTQNVVPFREPQTPTSDADLVQQLKAALVRRDQSRADWIEASVQIAGLLCEARERYPQNQRFADWLEKNEIAIMPNDRAALLKLGQDLGAMRIILERTERVSYEHIWRDVQKQIASYARAENA